MPAKTTSNPPEPRGSALDDIDSYLLEEDFDLGNPFRSPSPDAGKNKRKEPEGLGIDEEVEIKKRATVPRVKLDETRLLSEQGIHELRKRAKHLKLKGKGHEFSNAARLLSFYQLWLDDLFPKAKFLDALTMVEKAGHKTSMHRQRMEWINEGKPKAMAEEEEDEVFGQKSPSRSKQPDRVAPIFEKTKGAPERPRTPVPVDDLFGGEDIYGATPRAKTTDRRSHGGEPDDELDALMAQEDAERDAARQRNGDSNKSAPKPFSSIFGGGEPARQLSNTGGDPDEDELDALMAEAELEKEAQKGSSRGAAASATETRSIFGGGGGDTSSNVAPLRQTDEDDMDDLDALMAEAEANKETSGGAPPSGKGPGPETEDFTAEEEAMAEMDGLW